MKKTSETIVFFGNERLASGVRTETPTFQALIDGGYKVAAVIANYQPAQSRSQRSHEIEVTAQQRQVPVLTPQSVREIIPELQAFEATIGVLVAFGKIVPQAVIDIFPRGIINIHPSLLPYYRGPTPIEQALLDGVPETGVSLMKLTQKMDAGPIYGQSRLQLSSAATKQQVATSLLALGSQLLIKYLPQILDNSLEPTPQDAVHATYSSLIRKENGRLDWRKPAELLEREIRAYLTWPQSRTTLGTKEVIITKARAIDGDGQPGTLLTINNQLVIYTGQGALAIEQLKPAGKPEMSGQAFLAGYKSLM